MAAAPLAAPAAASSADAAADEEAATSIMSLPTEVEQQIFASLSSSDLAACMATCRAWRASAAAPALWRAACSRRWPHGGPPGGSLPAAQEAQGSWRGVYSSRRQVGLGAGGALAQGWVVVEACALLCKCTVYRAVRRAALVPVVTSQADAEAVALLDQLQWPDRRQAAMRQLAQLGFPAIRDALQALVIAAEALRQPSLAAQAEVAAGEAAGAAEAVGARGGAGSSALAAAAGYTLEERPNAAEWPDMAAAAAAAPCGAAYWARHAQRALCVQHCAQELRRRLLLYHGALAEFALRAHTSAIALAAERGTAPVGLQEGTQQQMQQMVQRYEREAGPNQPRLSEMSAEQLRLIVLTSMEEGAVALTQVHRPAAGACP